MVGKDLEGAGGPRRALLYGYGGFEISLTPHYESVKGSQWMADGNLYVIANIRGGGEYGPEWHQAALKEKRPRAYEDFEAVADDLIRDTSVQRVWRMAINGVHSFMPMGQSDS